MINYKVGISFVLGALFGGALGAYLMKDRYEKESREAIDSVKEFYRSKYGIDIPYKNDEDAKDGAEDSEKEEKADPRPTPAESLREAYFDDKDEYTEEEYKELNKKDEEQKEEKKIFVIRDEDYFDGNPHYGKETLYFYMKDKTLADENYEEVEDDSIVGPDISKRFEQDMGEYYEDDPIYIRNDALGVDYQIIPRNASFYNDLAELQDSEDGNIYRYN